ncbi:hypothetical protein NHQ30_011216 [Ciborinia camelliae]|nr:hypothetical protein NHQ30_011216 [Ciborinia camelliae]
MTSYTDSETPSWSKEAGAEDAEQNLLPNPDSSASHSPHRATSALRTKQYLLLALSILLTSITSGVCVFMLMSVSQRKPAQNINTLTSCNPVLPPPPPPPHPSSRIPLYNSRETILTPIKPTASLTSIDQRYEKLHTYTDFSSPDDAISASAWNEYVINGFVALPHAWAQDRGWPLGREMPGDPQKGIYVVDGFHQLHCLRSALPALRPTHTEHNPYETSSKPLLRRAPTSDYMSSGRDAAVRAERYVFCRGWPGEIVSELGGVTRMGCGEEYLL